MASKIDRKSFIGRICSITALAGLAPFSPLYGSTPITTKKPSPSFNFGDKGTITFLMLADWHLRMKDKPPSNKLVLNLEKKIKELGVSFVVLSGDNVSPNQNTIEKFPVLMGPFVEMLKRTKTSLAIAFGNHDSEQAPDDPKYFSRQAQYDWFKQQLGDLFINYDIPELTGVGTGTINIHQPNIAKPTFKIYLADSGSYVRSRPDGSPIPSSGWDNPHRDQIAWYMNEIGRAHV